jgi:hypothetical protein
VKICYFTIVSEYLFILYVRELIGAFGKINPK